MGVMRYSDDGEPGGTAGMPIIEVMKARGVTDCVVVVTRYFGGILLGAGGLVRAYSQGAAGGVNAGRRGRDAPHGALPDGRALPHAGQGRILPQKRARCRSRTSSLPT